MSKIFFAIALIVLLFPATMVVADQSDEAIVYQSAEKLATAIKDLARQSNGPMIYLPIEKPAIRKSLVAKEKPVARQDLAGQELSDLKSEVSDLKGIVKMLLADRAGRTGVAVMPVENADRIPQVGDGFRDMIVSSLSEHGVPVIETLDEETLQWVRRQDQLIREGVIDPLGSPRLGQMQAASHFLLASVTKYEEKDDEYVKAGIITIFGSETRTRTGSLVVDFKLVDARTGEVVLAFRTESCLKFKEVAGVVVGKKSSHMPMPETAGRDCACQAAERIFGLFDPEE